MIGIKRILDVPTRTPKKVPEGFEAIFQKLDGKPFKRSFKSEHELIEYLKNTKLTEAPISFRYRDDSKIEKATLDRVHRRFFGEA
jgi:hypothetical protein